MKRLFIILFASLFCVGLFAAGPEIPIIDANIFNSEKNEFDASYILNYINDSCTNIYSIFAIKDSNNKEYEIIFTSNSCITDIQVSLIYSFRSEKVFNTYLKNIDTLHPEKSFKEIREFFISKGITPKNIYSEDRKKVEIQVYEMELF